MSNNHFVNFPASPGITKQDRAVMHRTPRRKHLALHYGLERCARRVARKLALDEGTEARGVLPTRLEGTWHEGFVVNPTHKAAG